MLTKRTQARLVQSLVMLCSVSCTDDEGKYWNADAERASPADACEPASEAGRDELDAVVLAPPLDASSLRDALDVGDLDAMRDADAAQQVCSSDAGTPQLAAAVVEHACLHGSDGPFRVVLGGNTPETAPDVSRAHTLFTVIAQTGATLYLRYLPKASGDHVLFVARAELVLAQQGASSVAQERMDAACSVLPTAYVLPLPGSEPLELALRTDQDSFAVVLESLATWGDDAWACSASPPAEDAGSCRRSGPCSSDSECCSFCHDYDRCR